jgi:lysophospholipase L1-like esterase
MNYSIVGDSLIQRYEHHNVTSYPGMTLEHFVANHLDLLTDVDTTEYIFCFGANDLASGIPEDEVIQNYSALIKKNEKCCLILPPFQTDFFYEKCFDKLDCTFIPTFMQNYTTVDGLHPTKHTLSELKIDIENV